MHDSAGWDRGQAAQALAAVLVERADVAGWTTYRLTPLLAGLAELEPWLAQWHHEYEPEFGASQADDNTSLLDDRLNTAGITRNDAPTWRPPTPAGRHMSTQSHNATGDINRLHGHRHTPGHRPQGAWRRTVVSVGIRGLVLEVAMSRETMIALRSALADDQALQMRLAAAATDDEFIRIAADADFLITLDDLSLLTTADVSDAELETISGGAGVSLECRPMYPKTWNYCDW